MHWYFALYNDSCSVKFELGSKYCNFSVKLRNMGGWLAVG